MFERRRRKKKISAKPVAISFEKVQALYHQAIKEYIDDEKTIAKEVSGYVTQQIRSIVPTVLGLKRGWDGWEIDDSWRAKERGTATLEVVEKYAKKHLEGWLKENVGGSLFIKLSAKWKAKLRKSYEDIYLERIFKGVEDHAKARAEEDIEKLCVYLDKQAMPFEKLVAKLPKPEPMKLDSDVIDGEEEGDDDE